MVPNCIYLKTYTYKQGVHNPVQNCIEILMFTASNSYYDSPTFNLLAPCKQQLRSTVYILRIWRLKRFGMFRHLDAVHDQ